MIGKTGWTALIAVFMAVAFLPGVFAQQTAIENGAVIEAREQAEVAATGALGGLDLGALLGGGLGGILSGIGGLLSGFGGGLGGMIACCSGIPIVGTLFTIFCLPLYTVCAFFAAKLYGMTGIFDYVLACLSGVCAIPAGLIGVCADFCGFVAGCCGLIGLCGNCVIPDTVLSIAAAIYGLIAEFSGALLGVCSICINPCVACAGLCGGVITSVAGVIGAIGSVCGGIVSAIVAVLGGICTACISLIPSLCCTGTIEGCLAGCLPFPPFCIDWLCCIPSIIGACIGACVGFCNPTTLKALCCTPGLIACIGGISTLISMVVTGLLSVCAFFLGFPICGASCIDGCASLCVNPCTSLAAFCSGLLAQLLALVAEACSALEVLCSGACCVGGIGACCGSLGAYCGGLLGLCGAIPCAAWGTCKVPCVCL